MVKIGQRLAAIGMGIVFSLPVWADTVSIAVAANFTDATRDIIPLFEKATGYTVKPSFGSTGKLYAQIEHGAPFELFLAADSERPEKVEASGLGVEGTRFTYVKGRLVLWSANEALFDETTGRAFLTAGDFRKVAMANPKTAPYGSAAREVMERLGVWSSLRSKAVRGDSIAQTFQFTVTGNADVGFLALSQVRAWKRPGSEWVVPQSLYTPIAQQVILLKRGKDNPAAWAFLDFLQSEAARAVMTDYGYGVEP